MTSQFNLLIIEYNQMAGLAAFRRIQKSVGVLTHAGGFLLV